MPSTSTSKIIATAVGRRKSSVASVRLISGNGEITVNNKPAEQYFSSLINKTKVFSPFKLTNAEKYSATVRVAGGGPNGQMDAVTLGIARALVEAKETFKTTLRQAGLLTRDSRERQRRMVGTGGKARRQKQSPKR